MDAMRHDALRPRDAKTVQPFDAAHAGLRHAVILIHRMLGHMHVKTLAFTATSFQRLVGEGEAGVEAKDRRQALAACAVCGQLAGKAAVFADARRRRRRAVAVGHLIA